jgi:hypothetical protein
MARVSTSLPAQNFLCQQAFPPNRDQTFHVELRRV